MDNDVKLFSLIMGGALASVFGFIAIIMTFINWGAHHNCETYAAEMHTTYRYGFIDGCRIAQNGAYVPLDLVREWRHDPH